MNWLKDRISEASSHISLGMILGVCAYIFPQYSMILAAGAGVFGVSGFVIPEAKK